MISKTAQYALRAVVCLAYQPETFVSRADIADSTGIPSEYLLKVMNELDGAGIVRSRRGPGGGYCLVDTPDDITVLQVVSAVETIPRISKCPLGISDHVKLCPLHQLLDRTSQLVEEAFAATYVTDLIPGRKRSKSCDFPRH